MSEKIRHKIAIVSPAPFYYQTSLYRRLSESPEINLTVYYCSDETLRGADVEERYHIKGKFCDKGNLLGGYRYKFIKNYSPSPSYLNRPPFGLMNFGIFIEILANKYELVVLQSWTHLTWWLAFYACLLSRTPYAIMVDENVLTIKPPLWKKIVKSAYMSNFLFRFATGFLTAGSANEDLYRYYGVPEKKFIRMYFSWGYEHLLEKSEELKPKRNEIRKSFGINDGDFVALFVGRLSKYEKNIFTLLDAYKRIARPNKKLFFVGDGPSRLEIEQYVKNFSIENVYFKGFQGRDNISKFYAIADTLILPSTYEPWGIVVNEAMCFGLPVIVSDKVGAGIDLIKDDYNGFVFPAKNAEKLAGCMQKLIDLSPDERRIFGGRSLEIIARWINAIDPIKQLIKLINL